MTLDLIVATLGVPGSAERIQAIKDKMGQGDCMPVDGSKGLLHAYQSGYEESKADVLAYIHDDVVIHEDAWDLRVLKEFEDLTIGVVGFGGALAHGSPDIYKIPYNLLQLGRSFYQSNMDDAELHGERFEGACDVATLDGFALVVRRSLLDLMGGWPVNRYPSHHNYDYYCTLSAHRFGFRCRLVGMGCHHLGGLTATSKEYQEWARTTKWGSDAGMHEAGHRMIYEEFRDVLPVDVRRTDG